MSHDVHNFFALLSDSQTPMQKISFRVKITSFPWAPVIYLPHPPPPAAQQVRHVRARPTLEFSRAAPREILAIHPQHGPHWVWCFVLCLRPVQVSTGFPRTHATMSLLPVWHPHWNVWKVHFMWYLSHIFRISGQLNRKFWESRLMCKIHKYNILHFALID